MKIRIGNGGVPADDHIVADAQLLLAEQHRVGKEAVSSNFDSRRFAQRKMDAIHSAVLADNQGRVLLALEAFKSQVALDHRVGTQPDIGRQFAIQPATGRIFDF